MRTYKKLFKHGGSYAVVLPAAFVKHISSQEEVAIDLTTDHAGQPTVMISTASEFDTIEQDPLFAHFIKALYVDAMQNPEKLRDAKEVWGKRADKLLKGIEVDDD